MRGYVHASMTVGEIELGMKSRAHNRWKVAQGGSNERHGNAGKPRKNSV
jgi:hypothetical protein